VAVLLRASSPALSLTPGTHHRRAHVTPGQRAQTSDRPYSPGRLLGREVKLVSATRGKPVLEQDPAAPRPPTSRALDCSSDLLLLESEGDADGQRPAPAAASCRATAAWPARGSERKAGSGRFRRGPGSTVNSARSKKPGDPLRTSPAEPTSRLRRHPRRLRLGRIAKVPVLSGPSAASPCMQSAAAASSRALLSEEGKLSAGREVIRPSPAPAARSNRARPWRSARLRRQAAGEVANVIGRPRKRCGYARRRPHQPHGEEEETEVAPASPAGDDSSPPPGPSTGTVANRYEPWS